MKKFLDFCSNVEYWLKSDFDVNLHQKLKDWVVDWLNE